MKISSPLILGAIISLCGAIGYQYREQSKVNASVASQLSECQKDRAALWKELRDSNRRGE